MTKKSFNKLESAVMPLIGDNIAFSVAGAVVRHAFEAAKTKQQLVAHEAERPANENKLLADSLHQAIVGNTNIIDAAELDGIPMFTVQKQIAENILFRTSVSGESLTTIDGTDYTVAATGELATEMGVEFINLSVDEQRKLVEQRCADKKRDAKSRLIGAVDKAKDLSDYVEDIISQSMDGRENAVTSVADPTEYLELRETAFNKRLAVLNSESAPIDGEWLNRHNARGIAQPKDIRTLNNAVSELVEEAIRCGIDVSAFEALPSQDDIAKVVASLKAS